MVQVGESGLSHLVIYDHGAIRRANLQFARPQPPLRSVYASQATRATTTRG